MKKIQRLTLFVCFLSFIGVGQAFGQDPVIICPSDITLSANEDYTDTDITGVAEAFLLNEVEEVEYNDIIININNGAGFVRRRWNVVDRSDIFCDQTINVGTTQLNCNENVVASLSVGSDGSSSVKIFAQSLSESFPIDGSLQASRDGVFFDDFIVFDCCDVGVNSFYIKSTDDNGTIETCTGEITIEDKLAPTISGTPTIHLSLYDESSVELTIDMLSNLIEDNCDDVTGEFSPSVFTSSGEYSVDYTISDASGNTSEGTINLIIPAFSTIVCNNNVNISLDNEGKVIISPDMVLEGFMLANGDYKVSVNGGPFNKLGYLNCSSEGTENQVTVRDENSGNECWATVLIEDKLAPVLSIPDVVYLTLNVPTEALLTLDMIDRYTFDNCGVVSKELSQSLFVSEGSYDVTYTVEDVAGNQSSQDFIVIVTSGPVALACNNTTEVILNDEGQVTIDYFQQLEGQVYLNGNFSVGITDFPNEVEDYFNTIDLDCSHVGQPLTIAVRDEFSGNTCWGQLTVLDKTPPTPYAMSNISVSMNGAEPYILDPALIDLGSFDNCDGEVSMAVSPNTFYTPGIYTVKLRVYDESGNSDFATTTVEVLQGNGTPIECIALSTALLNPFGPTTLYAVDFLLNPDDFASVTMSTSPNGTFTETIDFDCAEYDVNTPFDLYIKGSNNNESATCVVSLTLIDNTPPVVVSEINIVIELENCQAIITTDMIDDGSYDLCGDIELSLSQTIFTSADIGNNLVTLTATDESGNTNFGVTSVTVLNNEFCDGCSLNDVISPDDITIYDSDGSYANLSIDNLQSVYGYSYQEVHPYTLADCDNLAYTYEDIVIPGNVVTKVLRTFTILDWLTVSLREEVQIIKLFLSSNESVICVSDLNVNVSDGSVQLTPEDVLVGSNYDYSNLQLTISLDGVILPDNIITSEYVGQTLYYEVVDITGNKCFSNITVVNNPQGCPLDVDEDVTFPLESIYLANSNIDPSGYTPEKLVSDYGFALEDVNVIIDSDCALASSVFEDVVIFYTDNNYKIERTFTVLDWITYVPQTTEGIYTFVQTINVGVDPNTLICDVLPNSAPVGDCDTGHTLEDDVEWPSDISISDYNITPEELIENSGIEEKDAKPIFFNNPDDYTATYIDLVMDLNPTLLTISRVWKVVNNNYDISWNYSQTIEIDFTGFQNLVTVSTATDRAVPGVIINNTFMTNAEGHAQVPSEILSIDFDDEVLNGVNVRDLILIQRHILDLETLDERLILAADANNDNQIKASDILKFSKRILGVTDELEWDFVNSVDEISTITKPRATYTAYKKGDVDDSAILPGDDPLVPTSRITITDKVLNNGETYLIPVSIEDAILAKGMEIRLGVNTDLVEIKGIENNLSFEYNNSHVNNEELVILMHNFLEDVDVSQSSDQTVVYIELKANANTLLSNAISTEDRLSYLVDEDLELTVLAGEIDNVITGNNNPELASVNVYPNPTSDYLVVDMKDISVKGDLNVSILNAQGQIMTSQKSNTVDVQSYSPGVYFYEVQIGDYEKKGKFLVIR